MQNVISSLTHPLIKRLIRLKNEKKERNLSQTALMIGDAIIMELSSHFILKTLLIKQGFSHPMKLSEQTETYSVPEAVLKKVSALQSPPNLIAEFAIPKPYPIQNWDRILVLDRIQDPTNFGTLVRTALAMGFKEIFLTPGCCDPFNEKALRGARGSTFYCQFHSSSPEALLQTLKEHQVHLYSAHMEGSDVAHMIFQSPFALVLGNEGQGLDPLFATHTESIKIAMESQSESLNVAIAGSILMHEMRKSR